MAPEEWRDNFRTVSCSVMEGTSGAKDGNMFARIFLFTCLICCCNPSSLRAEGGLSNLVCGATDEAYNSLNYSYTNNNDASLEDTVPNTLSVRSFDHPTLARDKGITPVGRIELMSQIAGQKCLSWCTGFIVGPMQIATAYHCIPTAADNLMRARIRFGFEEAAEGIRAGEIFELDLPKRSVEVVRIKSGKEAKSIERNPDFNSDLDWSIIAVKSGQADPAIRYGSVPLRLREPAEGDGLIIVHHPLGAPKRWSGTCAVGSVSSGYFLNHNCTTDGGSSGAPIFHANTGQLIGIHTRVAGGVRMAAVLAQSLTLQRLRPDGFWKGPPFEVLRGAFVYLGKDSAIETSAHKPKEGDAPFGQPILIWMRDGNPISSTIAPVLESVIARASAPTIGNIYGHELATLEKGMLVRIQDYRKLRYKDDNFYWGRIENVACGTASICKKGS